MMRAPVLGGVHPLRIVTNWPAIPVEWRAQGGRSGMRTLARTVRESLAAGRAPDTVFVTNCDPDLTMGLVLAGLLWPPARRPVVAFDMVLRRPGTAKARLLHPLKRALLSRVDLAINLFRDARGLTEVYGIPADHCLCIPFKVNISAAEVADAAQAEDYVLCFGRSLRDFDTFFAAMARLSLPGAIARVDPVELQRHGARFTWAVTALPATVQQLDDDGSSQAQVAMMARAKLVVVPVLKTSIMASGISTALNAMRLGKCVIGSEGPGMSDIFTDEVLTVPAEDPVALADMIARAWQDDALRQRTAAAGQKYALAQGGEPELAQRVVDAVAARYG